MNANELDEFVARVTPERVHQLVPELEAHQPEVNRGTVSLPSPPGSTPTRRQGTPPHHS